MKTMNLKIYVSRLSAEIIESDHFRFHTQAVQHFLNRLQHQGRSADVVFDLGGIRMHFEVFIVSHLMDKAGQAVLVVFGLRVGKRDVVRKIVEVLLQLFKLVVVKHFDFGTGAVPECDLAPRFFRQQVVENMRA